MMGSCYRAELGELRGGRVTWTGSGIFAAISREICLDLCDTSVCCLMAEDHSSSNVPVLLESCRTQKQ